MDKLRIELGIDPNDSSTNRQLELILEKAMWRVFDLTNRDELVGGMESIVRELTVIAWNRRGMEGESRRTEGGLDTTFKVEMTSDIKARLKKYRIGNRLVLL